MKKEHDETKTDVMIELLARLAFGEAKIKHIVTKNKKNPESYVKGYNLCDGENNVTEIAKIVGVKPPTITPILKAWGREGIIYNLGTETKPKYKSLMRLN